MGPSVTTARVVVSQLGVSVWVILLAISALASEPEPGSEPAEPRLPPPSSPFPAPIEPTKNAAPWLLVVAVLVLALLAALLTR